jgi:hypothetical protein
MEHILEYEDFLADKGLVLEARKKDTKVLHKLIDDNLKNSQAMKKVVGEWKKAEGQAKVDLTNKLKELTALKQEIEKKITAEVEGLDKGIGLEVVKEALKNTVGLAFKDEDEYNDFKEFMQSYYQKIDKDLGFDKKTKSWVVEVATKALDKIYGEGHPGNKESGWYGALPGDFESVIIS